MPGTSKKSVEPQVTQAVSYSVTYFTHDNKYYVYADEILISFGSPRKHEWTYVAGFSDDGNYSHYNCPCAHIPGPYPPSFVGEYHYCESSDTCMNL